MLFLQPLQAVAGGATCRSLRASVVRPVGPLAQRVPVITTVCPDRWPGSYLLRCLSHPVLVAPFSPACRPILSYLRFSGVTGRSGPGLGGRLPSLRAVGLWPTHQTASKAIPSAALRALGGLETLALGPAARSSTLPTPSPAPPSRPRDSKPPRSAWYPRSRGSAYGSDVPRPRGRCRI